MPLGTTNDVSTLPADSINHLRRGELDPRVANALGLYRCCGRTIRHSRSLLHSLNQVAMVGVHMGFCIQLGRGLRPLSLRGQRGQ
jgi:hypothetical protein